MDGSFHVFNGERGVSILPNGLLVPRLPNDIELSVPKPDNCVDGPGVLERVRVQQVDPSVLNEAMSDSPVFVSLPSDNNPHIYNFRLFRFRNRNQFYYLVNPIQGETNRNYRDGRAYWLPQGRYINIPAIPGPNNPVFVFTPALSGCSIAVDSWNEHTLRAYHVQAGHEGQQYNSLREHGRGLIRALRYSRYGYYDLNSGEESLPWQYNFIENTHGLAYLYFDRSVSRWQLHYHAVMYRGHLPNPRTNNLTGGLGHDSFEMVFPRSQRILFAHMIDIDPNAQYCTPASVRQRIMENYNQQNRNGTTPKNHAPNRRPDIHSRSEF